MMMLVIDMRKVIKNGTVITMDSKREKVEKLDVVIDDDTIVDLVKNYKGKYDELIEAKDKIVMPGLINAHTHLGMSYFKATNDNLTLQDWLQNFIWPIEDKMTNEDTYYGTLLSIIEMIKTGTTCANDMYLNCDGSIKALKEMKMRCLFTRCVLDSDQKGEERIQEFLKLYENNKENDLIRFSVSPHALYTCNIPFLKRCEEVASNLSLPVHIHYCENHQEIEDIKKQYQKEPLEVLKETGLLNHHLVLAHATFIDDSSLQEFKKKDVHFVHNPVSNLNLGCGIADIVKYKDFVNIALGTDGQGSGNNLDLFYHMSLVDLLQKGIKENPTVFSSYDVLKMATINGAKALGMEKEIGSIEIGKKADIIMLDLNDSLTQPSPDLITNICHNGSHHVYMTMINGEILMNHYELKQKIDEDKVIEKVNQTLVRLNSME